MLSVYFSPHLCDAALSLGALIAATSIDDEAIICTIMAGEPKPGFTKSGLVQKMHDEFGVTRKITQTRKEEDVLACNVLKVGVEQLAIPEAVYRLNGDGDFLYTNDLFNCRRSVYGEVVDYDMLNTLPDIQAALLEAFPSTKKVDKAYVPLSIGKHVDHQLTRQAVEDWARQSDIKVAYYEDYPYSKFYKKPEADLIKGLDLKLVAGDYSKKLEAALCYKTQFKPVFGSVTIKEVLATLELNSALCNNCEPVWELE